LWHFPQNATTKFVVKFVVDFVVDFVVGAFSVKPEKIAEISQKVQS
jgi:hypothetical protein